MQEKDLAAHARDRTGPYDLSDFGEQPTDLALEKGQIVTWGSKVPGFGRILEIDPVSQQATVQVLELNPEGLLQATGGRKTEKDLDVLRPTDKKLAPDSVGGYSNSVKQTGPRQAADTSFVDFSRKWRELTGEDLLQRPQEKVGKKRADLSNDDLFHLQERLSGMSGYEYAKGLRRLEERHPDLTAEPSAALPDDELYRWGQEVLDGTDGRRRAMRQVKDARQEKLEYWRQQHKLGQPLPRELQDEIGGRVCS